MSDKPHRLVVLKGGPSAERDVSLRSGTAAAEALREAGYEVREVTVDDASFVVPDEPTGISRAARNFRRGRPGPGNSGHAGYSLHRSQRGRKPRRLRQGEDEGKVSAARRAHTRRTIGQGLEEITLPLPVFIKPNAQGSSVGTHLATSRQELVAALTDALKFDTAVLVERFIKGKELTVGVWASRFFRLLRFIRSTVFTITQTSIQGRTEYFCPRNCRRKSPP